MRWALVLFCLSLAAQEKEAALSKQVVEDILQSTTLVESPSVQDYVAQLGAKLAAGTYSFRVVTADRSLHQPVVLTGGYAFVPVKLLLAARDESEFAGMLAQALARGPVRIDSQMGTIPVVFLDGFYGKYMYPASLRERVRQMDLSADIASISMLQSTGFDPAGLVHYIERMEPADQQRITALQGAVRDLPSPAYADDEAFFRAQEQVRPAPPSPGKPPSLYR